MNRLTLFDGASIKSTNLSNWTADEWFTVFGDYFGSQDNTPRNLYSLVGWLYACVNLRADRVAGMPWAIFKGDAKVASDGDDLTAFPFLDNFTDLLELTEGALCLLGYAYWFKARNLRNQPLGLRWFAPDTIQPLYNQQTGIAGFRRFLGGGVMGDTFALDSNANAQFGLDDIVYFRLPNALSELAPGTPPAQAAIADAAVLQHMAEFKAAFFGRGAIKATVLTIDGNPADAEVKKLEAWWKRFFSGARGAWATAAVRAGVTPVIVGEGLESLSNNALTNESREAIGTALMVPASIVAANAANYATAQQDEVNFLNNCIIPECRLIERTLNRQLFAPAGLRLHFEPERLSAMQEDENERAKSYAIYVGTSMKPSIAAQMVGLNLPDGVTYESLDADLAADQAAQQAASEAALARLPKPVTAPPVNPPAGETTAKYDKYQASRVMAGQAAERAVEIAKLQRWAKGKKSPDVDRFKSAILSREEKLEALGDAAGEDARFPVAHWGAYP
jgi:HK97 family phage portal protein